MPDMNGKMLKSIRTAMNLDVVSMALLLGWPYRTYQDRELGNRGIPQYAAQQVLDAQERDRSTMTRIMTQIAADIDRKYPGGLLSQ